MLFFRDAGVAVAIDVPPNVCINNINITQSIHILFNDKECFNHRVTTKIYTVQQYLSHSFTHRVNTQSFKICGPGVDSASNGNVY